MHINWGVVNRKIYLAPFGQWMSIRPSVTPNCSICTCIHYEIISISWIKICIAFFTYYLIFCLLIIFFCFCPVSTAIKRNHTSINNKKNKNSKLNITVERIVSRIVLGRNEIHQWLLKLQTISDFAFALLYTSLHEFDKWSQICSATFLAAKIKCAGPKCHWPAVRCSQNDVLKYWLISDLFHYVCYVRVWVVEHLF